MILPCLQFRIYLNVYLSFQTLSKDMMKYSIMILVKAGHCPDFPKADGHDLQIWYGQFGDCSTTQIYLEKLWYNRCNCQLNTIVSSRAWLLITLLANKLKLNLWSGDQYLQELPVTMSTHRTNFTMAKEGELFLCFV